MYRNVLLFIARQIKKNRLLTLVAFLGVVVGKGCETILPFFFKKFIDMLVPGAIYNDIIHVLSVILMIWIGSEVAYRIANFSDNALIGKTVKSTYQESYEYITKHSYNFFTNRFVGELVKQINKCARGIEEFIENITWTLLPLFVECIVAVILMYQTHYLFGILISIFIFLLLGGNLIFIRYIAPLENIHNTNESKLSGFIADTLSNISTIKIFSQQKREIKQFTSHADRNVNSFIRIWNISAFRWTTQNWITIGFQFLLLVFALKYWQQGLVSVGDIVMIQTLSLSLTMNMWLIGRHIQNVNTALSDMKEIVDIMEIPHDIVESDTAKKLQVKTGKIEIKHLNFSYQKGKEVIKDFSLTIQPKEKVALVSRSGEGKSTLVKLLLRLYDFPENTIMIDGQDITKVSQESLRSSLSMVPQDITLFHRSLKENIAYGNPQASMKDIISGSKLAHAHEFISKLPEGYDTFVGERGVKLSGGERQRVAIARALLKNSPIIILDEATSSLDSQSEALIQKALKKLLHDKTAIVIAHRLSTIMNMDRIIVIENGKITEEGTHQTLIKKSNSHYKELWDIQSKGFEEKSGINSLLS